MLFTFVMCKLSHCRYPCTHMWACYCVSETKFRLRFESSLFDNLNDLNGLNIINLGFLYLLMYKYQSRKTRADSFIHIHQNERHPGLPAEFQAKVVLRTAFPDRSQRGSILEGEDQTF
jgi:hypothetical protein